MRDYYPDRSFYSTKTPVTPDIHRDASI